TTSVVNGRGDLALVWAVQLPHHLASIDARLIGANGERGPMFAIHRRAWVKERGGPPISYGSPCWKLGGPVDGNRRLVVTWDQATPAGVNLARFVTREPDGRRSRVITAGRGSMGTPLMNDSGDAVALADTHHGAVGFAMRAGEG